MIGELISAGASLLGGFMNRSSAKDAQAAQAAHNAQQIALQKEFAQSGIQWKAADAKAAGIHPLYALGASTPTFSPISASFTADTSMGNALASAGQDIGRAVNTTRTQAQRVDAFTQSMQALQLERGTLENQILKADLASKAGRVAQGSGPPFPGSAYLIPGQTQSGPGVKDEPLKRVNANPANPHQEPGAITDAGYARTSGGLYPVPSKDVKDRIEDNWTQEMAHFMRNNMLPAITPLANDPPYKAPPGKAWVFDPIYGYKLVGDKFLNRFLRYDLH